jgi:ElaB/YqjD/DUF883 family membrane-anchored ribosome-binding protein
MADPLQKDDFRFSPVDKELDERRGKAMAYQAPRQDPIRRRATVSGTDMGLDLVSPARQLPEGGNHRLNRAAEQVGGAIGRVVSQARKVPESARHRLHLVRDRAQQVGSAAADRISGSASSLVEAAEQRTRNLRAATQEKARELMDRVEERARVALDEVDELSTKAAERATRIKQQVEERSREWSMKARLRADQMRMRGERMVQEHPLEVLGCIAGAAFLAGVSLRIVRTRNARRY